MVGVGNLGMLTNGVNCWRMILCLISMVDLSTTANTG